MVNPCGGLGLWAKCGETPSGPAMHPLLYHLIDVASVASALWREAMSPATRRWFTSGLAIDEESAEGWVALWAGLHDIGKAYRPFQEQWDKNARECPHGIVSTIALEALLVAPPFHLSAAIARRVSVVVGGHHGVIPIPGDLSTRRAESNRKPWIEERRMLAAALADLFDVPEVRPTTLENARAMWLAGFISVADWIGSNTDFFPLASTPEHRVEPFDPSGYLAASAKPGARKALTTLGWTARPISFAPLAFEELFPGIQHPNPLQRSVAELADRIDRPTLVIVEAPMGEGKTEAALYLADVCGARLGMHGHYLALPTMATSNQMFRRDKEFLKLRYHDAIQLQLLHGHASLSTELEELETAFAGLQTFLFDIKGIWGDGRESSVVASTWFSARKRGLLSPFGVGTIDQALLAVLQTKHVFVRLFGLANKTIVLDEVHAYDAYMSTLIERLLCWLASLGCTVVLLSATLPLERRNRLLAAFRSGSVGSDGSAEIETLGAAYPRISWAIGDEFGERTVAVSELGRKHLGLQWIAESSADGWQPLANALADALVNGGCAAVICNTVARAQALYLALKDSGRFAASELDLFHARFLFKDRDKRETRCLNRFGKPDGDGVCRPSRMVLVATQVIESSLDLDFDLMVSELAPVDLLLQRAGRLHRHARPERPRGLETPLMWVIAPSPDADRPVFDKGSTYVYDEHVLLRTWLALRVLDLISVPEDVSRLIEAVYDDHAPNEGLSNASRERWLKTAEERDQHMREDADKAIDRYLKSPGFDGAIGGIAAAPREEDQPELHQALQALTRLSRPSVSVACFAGSLEAAETEDGGQQVDLSFVSKATIERILRNSVTISTGGLVQELLKTPVPRSWERNSLLRGMRPLKLVRDQGTEVGKYLISLDRELGIRVESTSERKEGEEA
jgi:CRISPR-associated endonuclease/helicase Cas3